MRKHTSTSKLVLRLTSMLAVGFIMTSMAAGCGPGGSSQPGDTSGSGSNTVDDGKTRLVLWDNEQNEVLFSAITAFEEQNPDVRIVVEAQGETSLDMAINAGTAPDIIMGPSDYVATYGRKGYTIDLTPYGAKDIQPLFSESCWNVANAISDKIYGIPFDSNIINFVVNKDMFDAAGATIPTTYEEMITAGNKIKAHYNSGEYYAYTAAAFDCLNHPNIGYKAWGTFQYYWWLWRMGGDIFNADQTEPTLNSQEGVEALQRLLDLKNNGLAPDKYYLSEFLDGKVAMIELTTKDFFNTAVASKKANFQVAMMPTLKEGVEPWTGMGLYCYSVTSASKNPQIAYDFLKFYCTNVEYQISYCKPYYFLPSLVEAQEDPYYKTTDWKIILEQAKYARATPGVNNWRAMDDAVYDAIQEAVTGSKTAKAALDAAVEQIKVLMNE